MYPPILLTHPLVTYYRLNIIMTEHSMNRGAKLKGTVLLPSWPHVDAAEQSQPGSAASHNQQTDPTSVIDVVRFELLLRRVLL